MSRTVDIHHHVIPAFYWDASNEDGNAAGGINPPRWSLDGAIAYLDDAGIDVAVPSISTPGVHFGDDAILAPEGHPAAHPRPRYHPQRLAAPAEARRQFAAAAAGVFIAFAVAGLFAGLAGTLLAGPLHHHSPALTGVTIFLTFGTSVLVQTTTTSWPAHRLVAAGIPPLIAGLGLLVASAWTSPPNLALFLTSGVVAGAGIGAIIRGSLTSAIAASSPDDRAGTLATFFTAGYVGLSLPVIGIGLSLQHLSPRVTLLIFGAAAAIVILAAAPTLARPLPDRPESSEPASNPITTMCYCFGAQTQDRDTQPNAPGADLRSTSRKATGSRWSEIPGPTSTARRKCD